jgi:cytochrome c553
MKTMLRLTCLFLLSLSALAAQEMSAVSDLNPEGLELFEKKIRPTLIKHCYQCHAEDANKIRGGLLLDTRETTRNGGDTGPAVVPHDLAASLLYKAITYEDPDFAMPPKTQLSADLVADFRRWIELGAPDPRERVSVTDAPALYTNTIDPETAKEHWAYRVPQKIDAPGDASGWAKSPIDRYIAAGLAGAKLVPAPDTDARTLLRRISFDLTGLPPLPEQVESFVSAHEVDPTAAVSSVTATLLASTAFGERWGRHWLDVARYAESSGQELNATYPHAWRYRDYVIDSFTKGKPLDEFIIEQLAGDLLPAADDAERAEHLVATGFLAIGTKNLSEQNTRQFRFDLVDEQIDTTTQALLGTTAACARCHDHKFDPISMADYYALAGIFLSSETRFGTAPNLQNRRATELVSLPAAESPAGPDKSLAEVISLQFQLENQREQIAELNEQGRLARQEGDNDGVQRVVLQRVVAEARLGLLERNVANFTASGEGIPLAMGVVDRAEPFDSQILIRGEEDRATTERVPRGFPASLHTGDEAPIPSGSSGRLELAEWITSPQHPLTARVYANRVWYWLMGEGIVPSLDNFGTTGEAPSHPELLDYLALRLIELDWSIKDLIAEIVASRTYALSSAFNSESFDLDPDNRLHWRANQRRLDAEAIRDAVLVVSDQLQTGRPEVSLVAQAGDGYVGRNIVENSINAENKYRSVYLTIVRGLVPESLGLFDFADPSLIMGRREVTNVPSQSLYLMNSPFINGAAQAMASYLVGDLGLRGPALAEAAFVRCFSRPPTAAESAATLSYIERFTETAAKEGLDPEKTRALALATFCQSLLASAEFRYLN